MGVLPETVQNPVMGYCILAVLIIDAHFLALHRMAANGRVHGPLILCNDAMDNRLVPAGNGVFLELGSDGAVGHIIFTRYDDPGGIHVDPVHDARPHDAVDTGQLVLTMVHEAVYKGMAVMSGSRMDHHSFRLVDEDKVLVLIENIQVHGLCVDFRLHGLRHFQLNPVIFLHDIACLYALAVNQDLP